MLLRIFKEVINYKNKQKNFTLQKTMKKVAYLYNDAITNYHFSK
jgi:hypothetical protein